ncbi:MAG: hypothetical protein F6K63_09560 [Moorea sp. SIO1G6]|nr:hypothetical protein [Moorena sp. SIO1G6]
MANLIRLRKAHRGNRGDYFCLLPLASCLLPLASCLFPVPYTQPCITNRTKRLYLN